MRAAGAEIPSNCNPSGFFYTFPFQRASLLATSPLSIHELEQWLWMHAQWVIADANDMTKQGDFVNLMTQVDKLSVKFNTLGQELQVNPGLTVRQSLRDEFAQVLIRYTSLRSDFVDKVLADGMAESCFRRF
jgi:hypothetical protein